MKKSKNGEWHASMEELVSSFPFFQFGVVKAAATATLRKLCASKEKINLLWEECQAYAAANDMSPHTVFAAQYLYDYAQLSVAQSPQACTVGSYKGHFVRYLDWAIPDEVGKYTEVQDREYAVKKYRAVGFPGFFGLVTAVSDELCFAMNQMPCESIDKRGVPATYWARLFYERVLRRQRGDKTRLVFSVTNILGLMEKEKFLPMSSMEIVMSNGNYHVAVAIHPGTEPEVSYSSTEFPLVCANRYTTKQHTDYNDLMDEDCYEFSEEREKQMKYCLRRIAKQADPDEAAEMAISLAEPVSNEATANITYFDFATKKLAVVMED